MGRFPRVFGSQKIGADNADPFVARGSRNERIAAAAVRARGHLW